MERLDVARRFKGYLTDRPSNHLLPFIFGPHFVSASSSAPHLARLGIGVWPKSEMKEGEIRIGKGRSNGFGPRGRSVGVRLKTVVFF